MPAALDLVGQRFGRYLVVGRETRPVRWRCRCDCGEERWVSTTNLRGGTSLSCGCRSREVTAARNRANATHGHSSSGARRLPSREYYTWSALRHRCLSPTHEDYPNYGARGIAPCARWLGSFADFLADMGPRPQGRSIDRIDNDGGYWCGHCEECVSLGRPANCRWATPAEQALNFRTNRRVEAHGKTLTLVEWSRLTGIGETTIANRLDRGWIAEAAVGRPVRRQVQLTHNGEALPLAAWAERTGLCVDTLRLRMAKGWEPARVITEPRRSWTTCRYPTRKTVNGSET